MATRRPEFITFTGVDDRTPIVDLIALSRRYSVEWGILFSPKHQGVRNRYPTKLPSVEIAHDLCLSAHLCGGYARRVSAYGAAAEIPEIDFTLFQRVQFNGVWDTRNPRAWADHHELKPILQTTAVEFPTPDEVSWLYDRSGGRGEVPHYWPPSDPRRLVGYAGGIDVSNVLGIIEVINPEGPYWLDMKGRMRDADDWFDLNRCEAVCRAVYGL